MQLPLVPLLEQLSGLEGWHTGMAIMGIIFFCIGVFLLVMGYGNINLPNTSKQMYTFAFEVFGLALLATVFGFYLLIVMVIFLLAIIVLAFIDAVRKVFFG